MIKFTIYLEGSPPETIRANCYKELRADLLRSVILGVYRRELGIRRNKTDAVKNTAVVLDLSYSHVWEVIKNREKEEE